jgi:hypothetical protein
MAFGLLLLSFPSFFTTIFMFILGVLLLFAAVGQLITLATIRRFGTVSSWSYLYAVLILIAGIVVLFNPFTSAETVLMLFGCTAIFYGVTDLFNQYNVRKIRKIKEEQENIHNLGQLEEVEDRAAMARHARQTSKFVTHIVDSGAALGLSLISKNSVDSHKADSDDLKELERIFTEYFKETGGNIPLWAQLLICLTTIYGFQIPQALKDRKLNLELSH